MSTKIIVDETEPLVDVPDPPFKSGDVTIRIGKLAEEHYHLLDFLGRGKFGEVKRCQEKRTGREYAAKLIAVSTPQDRKDVINEIEIMKKLHHKRIIQMYDAFDAKGETCLILEIIHGGELFDRVICDDFVLSEKACVCLVRQICEGLEYMHSENIIHLDMKPENVMCLSRNGNRIKIIDFGLAREYNPKKDMRVLFGTPEFMAPEVIQYEPIHYSTDMWSVGVICYVLLSGLSPFMGDTDGETLTNVIKGDFDFDYAEFDEVSDEALDLIERLLIKDKSKRLSAKQCLEHPWLRRSCSDTNLDLTKKRLKHYVYRRKWQKVVNAIIALKRMGVQLNPGQPATRSVARMPFHRPVINVHTPMSTKDDCHTPGMAQSGQGKLNRFKSLPDVRQDARNGFVVKTTHGAILRNKGNPPENTIPEDTSSSVSPVVADKTHLALDFSRPGWKKHEQLDTPEKNNKLIWDSISDDDAASSIADDLAVDLFIAESDDEKPPPKQAKSKKKDKEAGKLKSLISNFECKDDELDNPRRKCDSGYSEDSKSFTDSECQENDAQSDPFIEGHTIIPNENENYFFKQSKEKQLASQKYKPVGQTMDNTNGKQGWLKKKEAAPAPGYHSPGTNPPRSRWPTSPGHQSPGTISPGLKWSQPPGQQYSPGTPSIANQSGNKWQQAKDCEVNTFPRRKELSFPAANAAMDKLRTNTLTGNVSRARLQDNAVRNKKSSDTKKAKPTYYIKLPNGGAGVKALADLFNSKS